MPDHATARTGRRIRGALIASLAVNLAFVGLFAGLAWRGAPPGGPPPGLVGYARSLPEDHRRDLMRAVRADRHAWLAERRAFAAAREAFRAALTAEPFEPERLRAVLAEQRRAQDRLGARAEALLVERIAAMSGDERLAFAEALARRGERRPPRRE